MKKFTFMMALFVCAIGFSQTTSLSEWAAQNPQAKQQHVVVDQNRTVDAATDVSTMGLNAPAYVQKVVLDSNIKKASATTESSNFGDNNPVITNYQRIITELSRSTQADCSASNPSNGFENGRGNNLGNGWTVATDIIVPMGSDMMLNQVTTFEFMTAGGATVVSADITVYDDNAGVPGATVIATETLAPTSNTVVGSNFGFDISEVVFDITPVALAGDAAMDLTYWVAVQVTTSDGATAFWENSTASMIGNPQAFNDGSGWTIPDATQESVYVFTADCTPIGGGGADCSASNPSNGFENGRGNNLGNGWTVATDIIVPMGSDMMLNQVTTFEFMTAGGATVVSADITVYDDNAGVPGATVIATETLAPTSNTVVGSNFGFDVSEVVFDITPVALAGDAAMDLTYWVAVQVTTSDGATAFWENSTASMIGNPQAFNDGSGWTIPDATLESVYAFTADCTPIGGGGTTCDTNVVYDSTAVPFEIDGADTSTADCAGAPNLIPTSVVDESGIIGTDAEIVGVTIDIAHTWSGDLTISLQSPTGEVIILADGLSGNTDDAYNGTVFQDGGADITVATAPFGVGPYAAEGGDFATAFAGVEINGDWNLVVCDSTGGDSGFVNAFSLEICSTSPPPATCVASEDFDAGLPTGWSTVVNTGTCDWMNGVDLPTGGPLATNAMIFDDDACGNGADASNVSLMSDVYYTDNATFVTLTYDYGFQEAGVQTFIVEVYDGAAWQQVALYDADAVDDLQTESIDVTAYKNADFQVRWTFDDNGGEWGWYAAVDNFCLDHDAIEPPPVPANDLCADAIPVSCGDTVSGTTIDATIDDTVAPTCDTSVTSPGVWYVFNDGGVANDVVITMCSGSGTADYDTKLSVYTGDCAAPPLTCVVGNDDTCGLLSEVAFTTDGTGVDYLVLVHGFGGGTGNFTFDVNCIPVLGIADNTIEGFSFYPNPTSNVINISAQDNIEQVAIYNILGQKVVDQAVNATSSQINVADLATGTYIMKATVNGVTASYKVIKN